MAKLNKKLAEVLQTVVAAGAAGVAIDEATAKKLEVTELVELNPAGADESGLVLTRATQKGIDELKGEGEVQAQVAPVRSSVVIAADVPMPASSGRGGRGGEIYPFASLEVGQSFFVPATEARPNPAKSLASTVSSAGNRYAEVVEGQTRVNRKGEVVPLTRKMREFAVRPVDDGAAWGFPGVAGAGVWRTL